MKLLWNLYDWPSTMMQLSSGHLSERHSVHNDPTTKVYYRDVVEDGDQRHCTDTQAIQMSTSKHYVS